MIYKYEIHNLEKALIAYEKAILNGERLIEGSVSTERDRFVFSTENDIEIPNVSRINILETNQDKNVEV